MEDRKFLDSFKHKRLRLTLKSGTYVGTVLHVHLNKTVVLKDVVDIKCGRKFHGVKLFFGHEVLNVEFPGETAAKHGGDEHSDPGTQATELAAAEFQPCRNTMKLDGDDESECVEFVVIDNFYDKFRPAVMHIHKQKVISVAADSLGNIHHERLCWLQIATNSRVYLFDILLLGAKAFKNGLSMILENMHILKVTHDCRSIAACLMSQYKVNLTNIFDTQVADVVHFYMDTGGFLPNRVSTLQEVVGFYLDVPPSHLESLSIISQLSTESREAWHVRPCPMSLLKLMALSVTHLQPLRLVLLDGLMSDMTSLMATYLETSLQEMVQMQHISSSNTLPFELRTLQHKKLERQQRALDRYPLSDDGLLLRFSPRPHKEPVSPHPVSALQATAEAIPSCVSVMPSILPTGSQGGVQRVGTSAVTPYLSGGRGLFLQVSSDAAGRPARGTRPYVRSRGVNPSLE